MKNQYSYAILVENSIHLKGEDAFLYNEWEKNKKYALVCKTVLEDYSEIVSFIHYSNDLKAIQDLLYSFVSWYDYVDRKKKNMQQYISDI